MVHILRQKVKSSTIDSIGYDRTLQTLEIAFLNGNIYQYLNVSIEKHWGIMQADSKGSYLADEIKGVYHPKRIS